MPTGLFALKRTVRFNLQDIDEKRSNVCPEARANEIVCQSVKKHNNRLSRDLFARREALFVPEY